jgi:opacity protein-like surface antigen
MRSIKPFVISFVALALLALPATAAAQSQPGGAPSGIAGLHLARFDVSGSVGWANGREEVHTSLGNGWYHDAASFGVTAGFYWTEHLKFEVDAGTTGEGRLYAADSYLYQEHSYDGRRVAATAIYQFGHNAWVHPFVGAGVDVERQQHRIDSTTYSRSGAAVIRSQDSITETTARPMLTAGLKAYLTPRAFFRSDVAVASSSTVDRVMLRVGVGVDF